MNLFFIYFAELKIQIRKFDLVGMYNFYDHLFFQCRIFSRRERLYLSEMNKLRNEAKKVSHLKI
jgi:hypothetical protein